LVCGLFWGGGGGGGVNEYVCMACRGYFKVSIDRRDGNIQW